jgi:hypothetical protein
MMKQFPVGIVDGRGVADAAQRVNRDHALNIQ